MSIVSAVLVLLLLSLASLAQAQTDGGTKRLSFVVSSQTCASNGGGTAAALTVSTAGTSYVALTQSDQDGCALTLGETAPRDGQVLVLVNISANSATIADSSGVQETTGGTTITLAQYAAAVFIYNSGRWTQATPGGGGTTDAPVDATYLTQTANGTLTNEQALAALSTGYMKVTTTTGAVTSQAIPIPAADGGTGLTLCTDDQVLVSNGTIYQCKTIPDCNVVTEKLLYDDATNVFSCQTDQVAAGAGSGDVVGPAAATDECFARFDTTTGKLIQDSVICASNAGLITFPDGIKQTFNPDGTTAGLNVGSQAGDPSAPANGDLWYDSTANELTGRINGANVALGAGGGGGDSTTTDTEANQPSATNDGNLFLPNNGFYVWRDTGAILAPWGPIYPMTPPVSGDFAWINQGAATISTTNGGVYLFGPKGASHNWRIRKKSAPATPYTITVGFLPALLQVTSQRAGPLFRQSSDGKFVVFQVFKTAAGGTMISVEKWDSPTAFSASYTTIGFGAFDGSVVWLRIADDGTNRICSYSRDGQNFIVFHTIGRTDFLTADEVGFTVDDESNLYDVGMTLLSWKQG